ncbi:MAG: bifunctional aldolase/short-chain dehydrogenase [Acidiferrobacteraceae bacterium]|nr:bifunctional aldolase/short-chain dehydrogenase [Acidiferrobacteraceae bacterium]
MKDLWDDDGAAECGDDLLALRVYSSRLIGQSADLVLHGGGNTSVKASFTDIFGVAHDVLYVKGSGWDLATIEAGGFAPVKLDSLLQLSRFDRLSDADMVRAQRAAMLDPSAPTPSVEAILHALIPYRFVDHTHADAVVALSNTPDGEAGIRSLYGDRMLIVPYVMPGFVLAKKVAELTAGIDWSKLEGMVLMNHGIFSFADDAKESYQRMIHFVSQAQDALGQRPSPSPLVDGVAVPPLALATLRREVSRVAGTAMLARFDGTPASHAFANNENVRDIATRGPLTPDHVIRTKRVPLIVDGEPASAVDSFARKYQAYFEENTDGTLTILDSAPRWAVWPTKGTVAFGTRATEVSIVSDIVAHTIGAISDAERLGGWCSLPAADIFAVEYWELEQAKLGKAPAGLPLQGRCAVVTGGASGIGYACAVALAKQGAQVTVLDMDPAVTSVFDLPAIHGVVCDVTEAAGVRDAIDASVAHTGGLDILVSNAGIFSASNLVGEMPEEEWQCSLDINLSGAMHAVRQSIPYLRLGWEPAVVIIGSKNVPAPGPGAGAYSVAKAGLTQLARVLALELAGDGIRVNTVHPNAVFDTAIWTEEVLASRAARYGMSVEAYRKSNLLHQEVTSNDVAAMVCAMAGATFRCTTGAQVPVDGGTERIV